MADNDQPSTNDIQEKPWKFIGYKGYAKFIASEDDFYIFRRYQVLNARAILLMQDEIAVLEEELAQLDAAYSRKSAQDLHNGRFRDDQEDRSVLLQTISEKLYRYSK